MWCALYYVAVGADVDAVDEAACAAAEEDEAVG